MAQMVTGIFGGIQARSAAKNAAKAQEEAADKAAVTIREGVANANPLIATGAAAGSRDALLAGDVAAGGVTDAAGRAITRVDNAAGRSIAGVNAAATAANGYLDPYIGSGQQATSSLSEMVNNPAEFKFSQDDPSYQFRLNEGMKALERSAASRGAGQGGAALKALTRYGQGVASTEYAAAFDRFTAGQKNRFSNLSTVAGMGLQAGGQAGQNLTGAAQLAGGYDVNAASQGGQFGANAASQAGQFTTNAQQFAGQMNYDAGVQQARNTMTGAGAIADAQTDRGSATAQGHLNAAAAWSSALNSVGQGVDSAIAGGFGGGSLASAGKAAVPDTWSIRRSLGGR